MNFTSKDQEQIYADVKDAAEDSGASIPDPATFVSSLEYYYSLIIEPSGAREKRILERQVRDTDIQDACVEAHRYAGIAWIGSVERSSAQDFINSLALQGYKIVRDITEDTD